QPRCQACHWNAICLRLMIEPGHNLTRKLWRIPFGHLAFPQFLRIALIIGSAALYIFIAVEAASSIVSIVRIILQLCCCFLFFAFAICVPSICFTRVRLVEHGPAFAWPASP